MKTRVFQPASVSVRETTALGDSRQIGAYRSVWSDWSSCSAWGQKNDIMSQTLRPYSSVSAWPESSSECSDISGPICGQSNSPFGPSMKPSADWWTKCVIMTASRGGETVDRRAPENSSED